MSVRGSVLLVCASVAIAVSLARIWSPASEPPPAPPAVSAAELADLVQRLETLERLVVAPPPMETLIRVPARAWIAAVSGRTQSAPGPGLEHALQRRLGARPVVGRVADGIDVHCGGRRSRVGVRGKVARCVGKRSAAVVSQQPVLAVPVGEEQIQVAVTVRVEQQRFAAEVAVERTDAAPRTAAVRGARPAASARAGPRKGDS